jgi:hypothetical protein
MGAAMGIAMGKTMVTGSGGRDAACKQFRDVWMLARIVDEDNRVGLPPSGIALGVRRFGVFDET